MNASFSEERYPALKFMFNLWPHYSGASVVQMCHEQLMRSIGANKADVVLWEEEAKTEKWLQRHYPEVFPLAEG